MREDSSYNGHPNVQTLKILTNSLYQQKPDQKAIENNANEMKVKSNKLWAYNPDLNWNILNYCDLSDHLLRQIQGKNRREEKTDEMSAINPLDNTIGNLISFILSHKYLIYVLIRRSKGAEE